jgi:hypothetical protein
LVRAHSPFEVAVYGPFSDHRSAAWAAGATATVAINAAADAAAVTVPRINDSLSRQFSCGHYRWFTMSSAAIWLNNIEAPIGLPPPGYVAPLTAAMVFPAA